MKGGIFWRAKNFTRMLVCSHLCLATFIFPTMWQKVCTGVLEAGQRKRLAEALARKIENLVLDKRMFPQGSNSESGTGTFQMNWN